VIPHLHVHLEPEERKRACLGLGQRRYESGAQFFGARSLASVSRVRVSAPDLADFLRQVHAEQRAQGVGYVELRISPRRFVADGMSFEDVMSVTQDTLGALTVPSIRAILLVNRDSPDAFLDEFAGHVQSGLPSCFVGVDLAGDEIAFPDVARFRGLFQHTRAMGLGTTVHAGEFGDATHVWRAVDELGTQRLGHAVAAARSATLLRRLAEDSIMVEVSLSSNLVLGAVKRVEEHPLRDFRDAGVPFCLNSDVPMSTGFTLPDELHLAARILGMDTPGVYALQMAAAGRAFDTAAADTAGGELRTAGNR
jgi:adenosine deaminase